MKVENPLCLVRNNQRTLSQWILGGNAHRTSVRVAGQRLDATERKHEAPSGVGPISTECHDGSNIKGADNLACRADLNPLP